MIFAKGYSILLIDKMGITASFADVVKLRHEAMCE